MYQIEWEIICVAIFKSFSVRIAFYEHGNKNARFLSIFYSNYKLSYIKIVFTK